MAARGSDRHLPPSFHDDMMLRIAAVQKRRHLRLRLWAIAGGIAAIAVAAITVSHFYDDTLTSLACSIIEMFRCGEIRSLQVAGTLFPSAALLLAADFLMRRKFKPDA